MAIDGMDYFAGWVSGKHPPPPIGRTLNFVLVEVESGRIVFGGEVLQVGKRVASAQGWLTEAAGKLLAHVTTTCLVFEA